MPRDSSAASQALRYVAVGGGSAVVEIGLFALLFRVTGGHIAASNLTAVCAATAVNFAANRRWAFGSSGAMGRQLALYLMLFGMNAAFTTLAIQALVHVGVVATLAKIATMATVAAWNFVIYRTVVFA